MATIKRFEDLDAWKKGRALSWSVYNMTQQKAFYKDFALRDQIRRAAISVSANIAEGFERRSNKEFAYFLGIAKGSAGEVRSLFYLALDYGYIDEKSFKNILNLAEETIQIIAGLIRYLSKTDLKGSKYRSG